jgi:uncharacterized membrane protein
MVAQIILGVKSRFFAPVWVFLRLVCGDKAKGEIIPDPLR